MIETPRIIDLAPKKLIGLYIQTSLTDNKTKELWQSFMPRRFEINNKVDENFYSIQVYPKGFDMKDFTPTTVFEKWAAVEVTDFDQIPHNLKSLELIGGLYAVFLHKGPAHTFPQTLRHIYETWLPTSNYQLDQRPHFEILDENYHPNDPNAQEEVWIPVRK